MSGYTLSNNLHSNQNLEEHNQADGFFDIKRFCWKDSYGRGIGIIPRNCPSGYDRIGLLCYKQCPNGMRRFGVDCHSVCPDDMSDQGLFCRKTEYGRGVGYSWKFGDKLNDNGMRERCQKDHGSGNCEKWGAVFYPKCRSGYSNFLCCICRPDTPNCGALGLGFQLDLSCAKKIEVGQLAVGTCNGGEEEQSGLCYKKCPPGYNGVGPVCWGQIPKGWVQCGLAAAVDKLTCADTTVNQVASVGQIAFNIFTAGSGSAATSAAQKSRLIAQLKQMAQKLSQLMKKNQNLLKIAGGLNKAYKFTNVQILLMREQLSYNDVTIQDYIRLGAKIAALADPTGVAGAIGAYTYPKCSKYFK